MSSIYAILNLEQDIIDNFALQGQDINNNVQIERILRRNANELKSLQDKFVSESDRPHFSQKAVDSVLSDVKEDAISGGSRDWEAKELRIVSYYLMRFQNNEKIFRHAMKIIDDNWHDMFISGLVFFIMNSWCTCIADLRELVSNSIRFHLSQYNGTIKRYLKFKENADFFEAFGPLRLAVLLITKKTGLTNAPSIIGLNNSAFTQPYFSEVIINYIKRSQSVDLETVIELFRKYHYLDRTKKLTCAWLVKDAERASNPLRQEAVAKCVSRILGDITLSSTWAPFTGASLSESTELKYAHELVIAWYARKSVETFFEVVCQDPRRRIFWLKYTKFVTDFRIVGSISTKTLLKSDGRVASMLKNTFIETNSKLSTTAALVLFIGNKVFVEFSDTGAVYIYDNTNSAIRKIKSINSIDKTDDLKSPQMIMAINQYSSYYHFYEQGKVHHRGEWETRLSMWFENIMKIVPVKAQNNKSEDTSSATTPTSKIEMSSANEPIAPSYYRERYELQNASIPQPSQFNLKNGNDEKQDANKENEERKIFLPGERIKKEIDGIYSKLLFEDNCRIIADANNIYLSVTTRSRVYYLGNNPKGTIYQQSIWLPKTADSDSFEIILNGYDKCLIGTISLNWDKKGQKRQVIFKPQNGKKVILYAIF